jgi:hypothetical protein
MNRHSVRPHYEIAVIRQSNCAIDLTRPIRKAVTQAQGGRHIIQILGPYLQTCREGVPRGRTIR